MKTRDDGGIGGILAGTSLQQCWTITGLLMAVDGGPISRVTAWIIYLSKPGLLRLELANAEENK